MTNLKLAHLVHVTKRHNYFNKIYLFSAIVEFRNLSAAYRNILNNGRVVVTNAWNAQLLRRDNISRPTEGGRDLLSILPISARHFRRNRSLVL